MFYFKVMVLKGNGFHYGCVCSSPKKCDEETEAAFQRVAGRHRSPSLFQALLYFTEVHVSSLDEMQGHRLDVEELNDVKCHFMFMWFEQCLLKLTCGLTLLIAP